MSLDRSLKISSSMGRHRNVLTRAERVAKLTENGKFDTTAGNPVGLPKVGNRKVSAGAKPKKEAAEGDAAAKPAAGAKAAAKPAAGAPAAKPAAKK
jgi:small basic protein (TIGR04137 family)